MHDKALEAAARAACQLRGLDWDAQADPMTSASGSDGEQEGMIDEARAAILAFLEAVEVTDSLAAALGETNIRTAGDPCRVKSWIAALYEPDYPSEAERERASQLADRAVAAMAHAVLARLRREIADA